MNRTGVKNGHLFSSTKIPLIRSISTPEKETFGIEDGSPKSIDDTDVLTQLFTTHSLDTSEQPPIRASLFEFFQPIRNQSSYLVDSRISEVFQKVMSEKRRQMGRLERSDKFALGIGGGILISESHMLITKHCLCGQSHTNFKVQFEYLSNEVYEIEKILSVEESEELGLQSGEQSDLIIVQLAAHKNGYPGRDNNFTALKEPANKRPSKLHFLGYTSGTTLKDSTMPGRPIKISEVITRGKNPIGEHAVWNDFKTHGEIIKQSPNKSSVTLSIQSPDRLHELTIKNHDIYRKNGTLANGINDGYVLYPNIFGADHARLAHRTKPGSSGGIYFTEHGDIFAVHCGRLPSNKDYPENIAFYPWTKTTTTIYNDRLIYETKPITLAAMIKNYPRSFKPKHFLMSINDTSLGIVNEVKKSNDGYQFTIQPINKLIDGFVFVVPFNNDGNEIQINGTPYLRTAITFTFAPLREVHDVKPIPALYRVTISDLTAGKATHQIPVEEQRELAERINSKRIKHSMTINQIRINHTSIGSTQQNGAHYEFVIEENGVVAIHAIGTHHSSNTYRISNYSDFFKHTAETKKLWIKPSDTQPMPVFRLD